MNVIRSSLCPKVAAIVLQYATIAALLLTAHSKNTVPPPRQQASAASSSSQSAADYADFNLVRPDQNFTLKLVQWSSDENNPRKVAKRFYVGSVHWDWCLTEERDLVTLFSTELDSKNNSCFVVDVGCNDGFYVNLAAAYGCKVYAFEVQKRCIQIARQAVKVNGFDDHVNIFAHPVSRRNNEMIEFDDMSIQSTSSKGLCDGKFFIGSERYRSSSNNSGTLSHAVASTGTTSDRRHKKTSGHHRMALTAISLGSFLHQNTFIDILKVDTEGMEASVLLGAMNLFKEKRIRLAVAELHHISEYRNYTEMIDVYQTITSYNYSLTPFNCRKGSPMRDSPDIWTSINFEHFRTFYATLGLRSHWRCPDLLIRPNERTPGLAADVSGNATASLIV